MQKLAQRPEKACTPVEAVTWILYANNQASLYARQGNFGDEMVKAICTGNSGSVYPSQTAEAIWVCIRSQGLGPGIHLPFGSFTGIPRAREQVPQGGAMNTPRRLGLDSHRLHRAWPSLEVRSATKVFPAFFWTVLSTPKDEENPSFCKDMVTRAEPAQISTTNGCEGHV